MPNTPLFPFGYGLSYTDFEISAPEISGTEIKSGETLEVSVTVKNVGNREGETVLQLYLGDEFASLVRPVRELKGFKKIFLLPGEAEKVSFTISEKTLEFWSENNRFEAEDGWFTAWVSDISTSKECVRFFYNSSFKKY